MMFCSVQMGSSYQHYSDDQLFFFFLNPPYRHLVPNDVEARIRIRIDWTNPASRNRESSFEFRNRKFDSRRQLKSRFWRGPVLAILHPIGERCIETPFPKRKRNACSCLSLGTNFFSRMPIFPYEFEFNRDERIRGFMIVPVHDTFSF